jgi:hypothetical protein
MLDKLLKSLAHKRFSPIRSNRRSNRTEGVHNTRNGSFSNIEPCIFERSTIHCSKTISESVQFLLFSDLRCSSSKGWMVRVTRVLWMGMIFILDHFAPVISFHFLVDFVCWISNMHIGAQAPSLSKKEKLAKYKSVGDCVFRFCLAINSWMNLQTLANVKDL